MKLQDKVAIVTGSSRGIGYSVAKLFINEGARVALCGSKLESAEKAVKKLMEMYPEADILPLGVDVSNTQSIKDAVAATMKRWNRVDILVNNAGITSTKQIFEMTDEDFDSAIRRNLAGAFKCIREVAPIMRDQGGGRIINTSSMVGT